MKTDIDFVSWLESRRKFAKIMMELAVKEKDKKDEMYYLGRMHEAKLVRDHLKKHKSSTSINYSNRVKKGWETRRKNTELEELRAKNEAADTGTGAEEYPKFPAGPTQ